MAKENNDKRGEGNDGETIKRYSQDAKKTPSTIEGISDLVEIHPVEVSMEPPRVKAGQTFKVKVRLAEFVGPGDRVFLRIKFQRILFVDGQITVEEIDFGYFDPAQFPSIIEIRHPDISGESGLARVKPDATQPTGIPPVDFPEDILVTVFIESAPDKHCSQAIRVSPA